MNSATSTSANTAVPRVPGFRGSSGSGGSGGSGGTRNLREPTEPREPAEPAEPQASEGFRPWHFFLLAALVTATVAVMLSRQSTPEHLVLISLTIIAAGLAAAGFYRTLTPFAAPDRMMFSEPLSERGRAALQREKMLVLRSIKELEFDRSMGKLSAKDFDEMSVRLRTRAIALMKQLDEGAGGYREVIERELRSRLGKPPGPAVRGPASDLPVTGSVAEKAATVTATATAATVTTVTCAACATTNDHDASFCKRCGTKL